METLARLDEYLSNFLRSLLSTVVTISSGVVDFIVIVIMMVYFLLDWEKIMTSFVNAFPNKRLIGYSYFEQMRDILPSLLTAFAMFGIVLAVELLKLPAIVTIVLQVIVGVVAYFVLSALFRLMPFRMLLGALKQLKNKKKN